ncbi:hypothetical protein OEZ60_16090 [Defluviimonas sp. WL0024]|uniref:SPOR domain-containing protein n=2 Tax=Albidovulum TaxID=205889 RepID=A0ABT3J346_9RHOB|nr:MULTISPECIES: hypothetical protein [Defluviimonas]MCU9849522.1 hypothetical protein [Defluviimonas sp. WL0024]MCW3782088.1 hypothetical protein [Defluviimonas salinarum]
MDYEQHMPGRSSYDPSRARPQMPREGGAGRVLLVTAVIIVALALVLGMAGGGGEVAPADPAAAPAATETAPAATE